MACLLPPPGLAVFSISPQLRRCLGGVELKVEFVPRRCQGRLCCQVADACPMDAFYSDGAKAAHRREGASTAASAPRNAHRETFKCSLGSLNVAERFCLLSSGSLTGSGH